jgi:uncharacterized damage-inducible protein DinB
MAKTKSTTASISARDPLAAEIHAARREWDQAVAGLSDDDFSRAQITAQWTLKDVLAHLAAYLELDVKHLQAYKKRGTLASMRARNWYQFNKRQAARHKKMPLVEVRAAFENGYNQLLTELDTMNDDAWKQSFPSPWSQNETRKVRLATVLRADVSNHLREHARQVSQWRESQ